MLMHRFLTPVRWFFKTVIAPPFCACCKTFLTERTIFCDRCFALIQPIVSTDLVINKKYQIPVFAICDYQEPMKSLIVAKSWSDIVASQQLAQLMWTMTNFRYQPCDVLVPVPLHWTRAARRGFNQAAVIATILASRKGCKVQNCIKRVKRTPFQSQLPVIDRPQNVRSAFQATQDAQYITGKHVFIVDDLMTTGATLKEVARELIPYKPASLAVVVACRVV